MWLQRLLNYKKQLSNHANKLRKSLVSNSLGPLTFIHSVPVEFHVCHIYISRQSLTSQVSLCALVKQCLPYQVCRHLCQRWVRDLPLTEEGKNNKWKKARVFTTLMQTSQQSNAKSQRHFRFSPPRNLLEHEAKMWESFVRKRYKKNSGIPNYELIN